MSLGQRHDFPPWQVVLCPATCLDAIWWLWQGDVALPVLLEQRLLVPDPEPRHPVLVPCVVPTPSPLLKMQAGPVRRPVVLGAALSQSWREPEATYSFSDPWALTLGRVPCCLTEVPRGIDVDDLRVRTFSVSASSPSPHPCPPPSWGTSQMIHMLQITILS